MTEPGPPFGDLAGLIVFVVGRVSNKPTRSEQPRFEELVQPLNGGDELCNPLTEVIDLDVLRCKDVLGPSPSPSPSPDPGPSLGLAV